MRALVVDVGTTSIRTAIVDEAGRVSAIEQQRLTVRTPAPGQVELDGAEIGRLTLELARRTLAAGGACEVVGVANQRATTLLFDPVTGQPVGPTLGWQDLRTVVECLVLQGSGIRSGAESVRHKGEMAAGGQRETGAGVALRHARDLRGVGPDRGGRARDGPLERSDHGSRGPRRAPLGPAPARRRRSGPGHDADNREHHPDSGAGDRSRRRAAAERSGG